MSNQGDARRNPLDKYLRIDYYYIDSVSVEIAQAMRSVIPGRDQQKGPF